MNIPLNSIILILFTNCKRCFTAGQSALQGHIMVNYCGYLCCEQLCQILYIISRVIVWYDMYSRRICVLKLFCWLYWVD